MSSVMRRLGFAFVLAGTFSGCSASAPTSNVRVYGGTVVQGGPALRSIVAFRFENGPNCSATLLSDDVALTAAHCILENTFESISGDKTSEYYPEYVKRFRANSYLAFGTEADDIDTPRRRIVAWASTSQWARIVKLRDKTDRKRNSELPFDEGDFAALDVLNNEGWQDIAVIRFEGGLPDGFAPARLAETAPTAGQVLQLAGYGISEEGENDSGVLQQTENKVNEMWSHRKEFEMSIEGKKGICRGDSGGPAFVIENDQVVVHGVVSRTIGIDTKCQTSHSVYNDVVANTTWINEAITSVRATPSFTETGDSVPTYIKLVALHDTYLKYSMGQSSSLPADEKCLIRAGETIQVSYLPEFLGQPKDDSVFLTLGLRSRCGKNFAREQYLYYYGSHFRLR